MKPTLYEVETTMRKAAVGAGLPFGLAEDCGYAAAWLYVRGFDGVEAALKSIRNGMKKPQISRNENREMVFSSSVIAVSGPSAIDFALSGEAGRKIWLADVDSPLLLVGLAAVAAAQNHTDIELAFSGGAKALICRNKVKMTGDQPEPGCGISIVKKEADRTGDDNVEPVHMEIDDEIWNEAMELAAKTYVPASLDSRTGGAGAGLTDND